MISSFIRRIRLELLYRNDENVVMRTDSYISTGDQNGLAISFSGTKTLVSNPNECEVIIKNLSPDSRKNLISNIKHVSAKIYANYINEPEQLLFFGDLLRAWPEKRGVSNEMKLCFMDGFTAISEAFTARSWLPETKIADIVYEVANDLMMSKNKVKVDKTRICVGDAKIGQRGYSCSGKTSSILDSLSKQYGFTWSVQNGVFQAYKDVSKFTEPARNHYPASVEKLNLLSASPELGEKLMQMVGMKIEMILNGKVKPGDIIDLTSSVYPTFSGTYCVHEIEYVGDTFGTDWKMTITSKQTSNKYAEGGK